MLSLRRVHHANDENVVSEVILPHFRLIPFSVIKRRYLTREKPTGGIQIAFQILHIKSHLYVHKLFLCVDSKRKLDAACGMPGKCIK